MKPNSLHIALLGSALLTLAAAAAAQDQDQDQDKVTHFTSRDGKHVTLTWGQPPATQYGPPPPFAQLDTDHNGFISRREADAYPPLANEFDLASHYLDRLTKAGYKHWIGLHNG